MPPFIECLLDQQYQVLLPYIQYPDGQEKRDPLPEELAELWISLYSEYCDLSQNSAMDSIIMQVWQRDCLQARIDSVKLMLSVMASGYNQFIADCLKMYGFPIVGSDDEDAYENQIRVQYARLKGEEYKLKKITEVLQSLETGNDELTKASFRKQLVVVSKHNGFRLRLDELTVAEYCDYIKDYRDHAEAMNNLNGSDA